MQDQDVIEGLQKNFVENKIEIVLHVKES